MNTIATKPENKKNSGPIKISLPISPTSYDPLLALAMANTGFSHQKIADQLKVDRSTISKGLVQLKAWLDSANIYSQLEAKILASLRQKIISSITVDELEKASINTKIWAIAVLFDKSQKLPKLEQQANLGQEIKELKQLQCEQKQMLDSLRSMGSKLGVSDDIIDVKPVDVEVKQITTTKKAIDVDRKQIGKELIVQHDKALEELETGVIH